MKAAEREKCAVCGKEIAFGTRMNKSNYQYQISRKGKTKYYCGYGHYQAGRIRGD